MKKLFYLFGLLLLVSCINSKKAKNTEITSLDKEEIKVKEKLDSCLVKGVLELIEDKDHLDYPDIPLDESFIVILFEVNPEESLIYFSDSTVSIHYNIYTAYDYLNTIYKGILDIEGINVGIFDENNFGERYYNADSLRQIPLEQFKPYPMNIIFSERYYIRDGELNYWNP